MTHLSAVNDLVANLTISAAMLARTGDGANDTNDCAKRAARTGWQAGNNPKAWPG